MFELIEVNQTVYHVRENGKLLASVHKRENAELLLKCIHTFGAERLSRMFNPPPQIVKQPILIATQPERTKEMEAYYSKRRVDEIQAQVAIVRSHARANKEYGMHSSRWQIIDNMTDEQIHNLIPNCRATDKKTVMQLIYLRIRQGRIG